MLHLRSLLDLEAPVLRTGVSRGACRNAHGRLSPKSLKRKYLPDQISKNVLGKLHPLDFQVLLGFNGRYLMPLPRESEADWPRDSNSRNLGPKPPAALNH